MNLCCNLAVNVCIMFMYVSFTLVILNASKMAKFSTVSKAFP